MKRYVVFFLLFAFLTFTVVSFTSCSSDKPTTENPTDPKEPEEPEEPEEPKEPETPKAQYLPLVKIETEGQKDVTSKDFYLNAKITISLRDHSGKVTEVSYSGDTEIKGRGNSTWNMEKKPYRLKLITKSEILGMPENRHWVLLANYSDKTLFRNELAFEIARRMGFPWTPRAQHVDVILNGNKIGNYMLTEHVRVGSNRVDIPSLKDKDKNITGGYFLEIDERQGEPRWFISKGGITFCLKDPEKPTDEQFTYISEHVQKVEDILYGELPVDITEELPKYLDIKSIIDYYLLNEISKNVDGNLRLSTFLYKKRDDDKLYFGPAWDYDIAFGNINYDRADITSGWHSRNTSWYKKLFDISEFNEMMKDRWRELRQNELADLDSFIDELATKLDISQEENFLRWDILNKHVWPNRVVTGSYEGEVDALKSWLASRIAWMDSEL